MSERELDDARYHLKESEKFTGIERIHELENAILAIQDAMTSVGRKKGERRGH